MTSSWPEVVLPDVSPLWTNGCASSARSASARNWKKVAISGEERVAMIGGDGGSRDNGEEPLVPLAEGWTVWPVAMLRSAGLPSTRLLKFIEAAGSAEHDAGKLRALLEDLASDRWLLEALSWQNPAIVNSWLLRYALEGVGDGQHNPSQLRRKLLTIGAYIQRYATKNETVGFYGPCGWAVIDPSADGTTQAPGGGARISHYEAFEPWAIKALAGAWAADPEVLWYLPVHVHEAGVLDGDRFLLPRRAPLHLTPDRKAVLEGLATHPMHASELLERLRASSGDLTHWTRDRLVPILEALQEADCLWWGFELPVDRGLEDIVLTQLSRLPQGELRSSLIDELQEISRLRDEVSQGLGDAEKTIEAMNRLGKAFEKATGVAATVPKNVTQHSRTLLYHDVAVDWGAVVGARSLAEIGGTMELMLATCRYMTWKVAAEVDRLARCALAEGDDSFETVYDELVPLLQPRTSGAISGEVVADVHAKIDGLLAATEPQKADEASVDYRSADLRERWLEAFRAPRHGWTAARLHCPDIMLSTAGDLDTWVLGELHIAVNTLDCRFSLDNQNTPGQLESLIDAATSERYIPAFPHHLPENSPRMYPPPAHYLPAKHKYWTMWSRSLVPYAVPKLSCVGLTVADQDGEVLVLDPAGQRLARLTDFIGEFLSLAFFNMFSLRPKAEHQRRIKIDDVVVHRRTWRFPVRSLPPANGAAALREIFDSHGIPRHTFVRVPGERKPVFCDSHSSIMTHNIIRLLRKLTDQDDFVQVQEMLPDVEHLWLCGADGDPVTSEFRFVVQDMRDEDASAAG
jgi:hypothetical protein